MFAEIRSWWEVPCIAHFCSLFRAAFGLTDFEIEDLEDALAIDGAVEDSRFLADLQARLLRGIYGKKHDINPENFELYLSELVRIRWEEELGKVNPLKDTQYKSLSPRDKVEILHSLCDWRLDSDDVSELLKGLEADSLRVEALGYDAQGHTYWYFYGTRLYKEEKIVIEPVKKEKKKKIRAKKRKKKVKKKKQKKKIKKKKHSSSESDFETSSSDESSEIESTGEESEEDEEEDQSIPENKEDSTKTEVKWSLVCSTAEEWEQLAEVFKKSKNRDEKALFQTLTVDFLPEIEKMIEAKEKAAKKKFMLEMAPRRQSDRIALKSQVRDEEEAEDEVEREKEEEERKKEEEEKEKEKEKMAEKRKTERAERARLREERQWLIATGELPPEVATALVPNMETSSTIDGEKEKKRSHEDDEMDRDEDLYTGLYKVLEAIKKHHNAWPFLEPVDESYAPQYFDIVENPMDLSSMEEKLDESKYKSLSEFVEDFKLMLSNCLEYNGPDSMYTKMSHSLEAAFTRLIAKHFPEDEDQDDWDFEEEFSKSKRKKKKLNRRGLKSIDDYISGTPKMSFDPASKMFVPEGESRDIPQRPNNLPLQMFGNMAMTRMPNGGMFPSQHPNMPFHPGGQPQFGNTGMYPPQLYQNSMPPQYAYGFGNPAQMRQINPRNMPPNFPTQAMGFPGMPRQQVMGQHPIQGGTQPIAMNQNQAPGQRMPLGVGQGQIPGQAVMSNQGQVPPGQLSMPGQGPPLSGVEQRQSPAPNQGHPPPVTGQPQLGMTQMQQNQSFKPNLGQPSSSAASIQSPTTSDVSSPSVGTVKSPTVLQADEIAKDVTSPPSVTSPVATSGEATPSSWTAGPSRESASTQQYAGQMPHNFMQHAGYPQIQQNPYYPSKNPAYRHPMTAYSGPRGGPTPMWNPSSMGQFQRQFQPMRPQDPSVVTNNSGKQDDGRPIDLSQGRFNPGTMQQMPSSSPMHNPLSAQSSTPTRSDNSPAQKSDNETQEGSQADKIDALHNQGISQDKQHQLDQRQYSAVIPERELASMRQGVKSSPQYTPQFLEQQRAKSLMHSSPLFGRGEQPLKKLEEMAFNKDAVLSKPPMMSPEHQHGDHSNKPNHLATNIQGSPNSRSSSADPDLSFAYMMGRNGQHQTSKETKGEIDGLQERPNSSPHERHTAQMKSMHPYESSPEQTGSNKQSLISDSVSGNSNINGASSLIHSNGSSQSGDEAMGKQKSENTGRLVQSQSYMLGSFTNHSIAAHLTVEKEKTIPENVDKSDETPSSRNSMITYLKELSSRNPSDPMNIQGEKPMSEQSQLNSNITPNDPTKSHETTRLRPPPPLQMHGGDSLQLGFPFQPAGVGGQSDVISRHRQMPAPHPVQRANPQEGHTRSFGSMFIDLDQRQPAQSLMNLDKSVPYRLPAQSLYTPQQQDALRRQQMFMLQRQMQVQEMGPYMSSQMAASQPGRAAMDLNMLQQQQQQYLNAFGRHLGRNGEFPGGFPAQDMSTKPRFS